jgi:hypothetical protein
MRKPVLALVLVIVALHAAVAYLIFRATEPGRADDRGVAAAAPVEGAERAGLDRAATPPTRRTALPSAPVLAGRPAPSVAPPAPAPAASAVPVPAPAAPVPDNVDDQELTSKRGAVRLKIKGREAARSGSRARGGVTERE